MAVEGIIYLAAGLVIGAVSAWLVRKYQYEARTVASEEDTAAREELDRIRTENVKSQQKAEGLEGGIKKAEAEIASLRAKLEMVQQDLARSGAEKASALEKLENQKADIEKVQEKFKVEFENLTNRIFDDKSKKFKDESRSSLDQVLNPLKEKIRDFQTKIEQNYINETKDRTELKQQLKTLSELNQEMSKEAKNLTTALKGDSKTQGNWGEAALRKILERSGLIKGIHFDEQVSLTAEDGSRLQPDFLIKLPDEKNLIIDAKVSLTAYERYASSESEEEKEGFLKQHIVSVKGHMKELSEKKYQNLYGINPPDFVIMFMPVEPALSAAATQEPDLFYQAADQNIAIVSPSILIAMLRTVSSVWRHENQNRNAVKIATEAGRLYDKFVNFVEDLNEVGQRIDMTRKSYNNAMNKLSDGTGNLIRRSEKIRELGAKTSKSLPETMVEDPDGPE